MTPERLSGFRYLANKEGSLFCAAEMREMLAEVDRLTARWEALKAWKRRQMDDQYLGYRKALNDMVLEMTRLEQEP